jgi:hypothetical protein
VNLWEKLKAARLLARAGDRLKEAQMKGGLKVAVVGLSGSILTAIVAKVTEICPTLIPNLWPIVTAGVLAGIAFWMRSPKEEAEDEEMKLAKDERVKLKR